MRTYERNGVHVEQCAACRGIFLDSGELEQLAAAERHHYAAPEVPVPPAPPSPPAWAPPPPRDLDAAPREYAAPRERAPYDWLDEREPYDDRYRDDRYRYDERYRKRRKKDFLDVLFDL